MLTIQHRHTHATKLTFLAVSLMLAGLLALSLVTLPVFARRDNGRYQRDNRYDDQRKQSSTTKQQPKSESSKPATQPTTPAAKTSPQKTSPITPAVVPAPTPPVQASPITPPASIAPQPIITEPVQPTPPPTPASTQSTLASVARTGSRIESNPYTEQKQNNNPSSTYSVPLIGIALGSGLIILAQSGLMLQKALGRTYYPRAVAVR